MSNFQKHPFCFAKVPISRCKKAFLARRKGLFGELKWMLMVFMKIVIHKKVKYFSSVKRLSLPLRKENEG